MRNLLLAVLLAILPLSQSFGFPRLAAVYEQRCNLCHLNPTGTGMRNLYGSQYIAQTELAVHKVALADIGKFQPNVSDNISLGTDIRTLYFYNKDASQSTFFQMEGKLYVGAQVTDRMSILFSHDLNSNFDVFATGYFLPLQGYVKVGRFQPSYGWQFADHTNFVRERMIWPPTYRDTGVEVAILPSGLSATLGFFNGAASQFDDNEGKALAARLEVRRHIGMIGFAFGGSYWRSDRPGGSIDMYGPLGYINLFKGRLIYLGEIDWLKDNGAGITTLATSNELSFLIRQGIWLEGKYDFQDPDTDLKSGDIARYSFSLDYFPLAFVELEPSVRIYRDKTINSNYTMFINTFHFFF